LKFHKCTDKDYDEFYPPKESDKKFFEFAKAEMGFYCFDEDQEDIILWGQNNFEYQRLELLYMPCQPNNTETGCANHTFEETLEYLKAPGIYLLRN